LGMSDRRSVRIAAYAFDFVNDSVLLSDA
jgi:hypothetical protein